MTNESGWKLSHLIDAISCVSNIYYSYFDKDFEPIFSTAPNAYVIYRLLALETDKDKLYRNLPLVDKPALFSNSLRLSWLSEIEYDNKEPYRIHILGPVFLDDWLEDSLLRKIDTAGFSMQLKAELLNLFKELPVLSISRFFEYGIMFHFSLTGERVTVSDIRKDYSVTIGLMPDENADSHGTYLALERVLKMVKEGNPNYKKELNRLAVSGRLGEIGNKDGLRKYKNAIIVFTAHCTLAAIHGGLASEVAYSISDRYIHQIEMTDNFDGLISLNESMIAEFVKRVRYLKQSRAEISPQIQRCCDLISVNPEDEHDIHKYAIELGYHDYYFSAKFKKEVGSSFHDFVLSKKIERACELLNHETVEIAAISEALHFATPSIFSREFKKEMGTTPGQYRLQREEKASGYNN
jgi:AraC-like DNA-binding protein